MLNPSKREVATIKLCTSVIMILGLIGYCLGANLGENPKDASKRAAEARKATEAIQAYQN